MDLSRYLPSLVRSTPADGDRFVPTDTTIQLDFSVALHPDVLSTQEISKHVMLIEQVTERSIPLQLVSPTDPGPTKSVTLRPAVRLDPDTDYLFVILPSLPAYTGRTAGVRTTIGFRTARSGEAIPIPVATSPAHNARVSALPVSLSWTGWSDPPSGHTVFYEVELARDERFADTVWTSVGTHHTVVVPESYTTEGVYAWRVRILLRRGTDDTVATGNWSPTAFFTVRLAQEPVQGGSSPLLVTTSIDQETTALLSHWPELVLYDVPEGYESIALEWRSADGYPNWDWNPMEVSFQVVDTVEGDGVVDRVQVIPQGAVGVSRLYRLSVRSGGRVVWEKLFYMNLRPLYCHPDVVRYRVGGVVDEQDMDDDDICFFIFRKSLEANRHFYRWVLTGWAGPTESSVRGLDLSQYFAVQRWVELQAAVEILGHAILRFSARMGIRQRLGDYADEYEANALREMRELRKQLQKESIQWLSEFSKLRAVAVTASKGSWNPAYLPGGAHEYPSRDWRHRGRWRG